MNKTLVIMAAGMGSRFGGIKQIEPVGPNGEIISDYNVFNAIKYGFDKVVFIIRKEHEDLFRENVITNFKDKIKVEFAYQELDTVDQGYGVPSNREKMLGTGHALLCAAKKVNEPFIVINADDFYGRSAFEKASKFIDENPNIYDYLTVNYPLKYVSGETGTVKRGVSFTDNKMITKIVESEIEKAGDIYMATNLLTDEKFEVDENRPCSVNFFVLKPSVFDLLYSFYCAFLEDINEKNECFLPTCLTTNIFEGNIVLYEDISESSWFGITYKEDADMVKEEIKKLIEVGEYPDNLWS